MHCKNDSDIRVVVQDVSADRKEMYRWALASFKQPRGALAGVKAALCPKHIDRQTWRRIFGGRRMSNPEDCRFIVAALESLSSVSHDDIQYKVVLERLKEQS